MFDQLILGQDSKLAFCGPGELSLGHGSPVELPFCFVCETFYLVHNFLIGFNFLQSDVFPQNHGLSVSFGQHSITCCPG